MIDLEKMSYTKNSTSVTWERLENASYLLRAFISKTAKKIKIKDALALIEYITSMIFALDGSIFMPLAPNFSKILHMLVSDGLFRDHLSPASWSSTLTSVMKALLLQCGVDSHEKFFVDLLHTVRLLLLEPMIPVASFATNLTNLLTVYFKRLRKENLTTSVALEIVNHTLILFSTSSVHNGLQLVKHVVRAIGFMTNTNFDALRDHISIFAILGAEYISSDLMPLITLDETDEVTIPGKEHRDDLLHLIDGLLIQATKNTHGLLTPSMVEFYNTHPRESTWFRMNGIGISHASHSRAWISALAVVSLINSFYTLRSDELPIQGRAWKKRKIDTQSFASALSEVDNPIQLYLKLTSSGSELTQALGIQLLLTHLSTYSVDPSSFSTSDVMFYEKKGLAAWSSITIRAMIQHGWSLSTEESDQLLHINLQMIKDPSYMDSACQLIIQILSAPSYVITDRSVKQLIRSMYEVPHVYGPDHVSDHSLKFWMAIADHSKFLNRGGFRTGDMIINWLSAKVSNSSFDRRRCDMFPYFILWLVGCKETFDDDHGLVFHDDIFTRFNSRRMFLGDLPRRMLNVKTSGANAVSLRNFTSLMPPTTTTALEKVIDAFILIMEKFDTTEDMETSMRLIVHGITIYQGIYSLAHLNSVSERLKYDIVRLLEASPVTNQTADSVLFELNRIKVFNNGGMFVMDAIKVELLNQDVDDLGESIDVSMTNIDVFDDFGMVRKRKSKDDPYTSSLVSELRCISTHEQMMVKLLIHLEAGFKPVIDHNISLVRVIEYVCSLNGEKVLYSLGSLAKFLTTSGARKISKENLIETFRVIVQAVFSSSSFECSPIGHWICHSIALSHCDDLLGDLSKDGFKHYFAYITGLAGMGIVFSESAHLFAAVLLRMMMNEKSHNINNNLDLKQMFLNTWKSSNFVMAASQHALNQFQSTLSARHQRSFLQTLKGVMGSPESSPESATLLCITCEGLSTVSYPLLVDSVNLILRYNSSIHFSRKIEPTLNSILGRAGIEGKGIPELMKLEVLYTWFSERLSFESFPFRLFGYTDFATFALKNDITLYAICRSHQNANSKTIDLILSYSDAESEMDLKAEAASLLIPLSFAKNGTRQKISPILDDLADAGLIIYQDFMITTKLLELADVSSETSICKYLPQYRDLALPTSKELHPLCSVGISVADVLHGLNKYQGANMWKPQTINFVASRLLNLISGSKFVDDKLIGLRRLKLLLVIGGEGLKSDQTSLSLIPSLIECLLDPVLHRDSAVLIEFVLSHTPDLTRSCVYPDGLLQVYDASTKYAKSGKQLSQSLKQFLLKTYSEVTPQDPWRVLFSPFIDVLGLKEIRLSQVSLHNALVHLSHNPTPGMVQNIFRTMSLVFEENSTKYVLGYDFRTHKDVAQMLLNADISSATNEVRMFISRYLGRFYLQTGESLIPEKKEVKNRIDVSADIPLLNALCDRLMEIRQGTSSRDESLMLDGVMGHLLFCYDQDPAAVENLVNVSDYLSSLAEVLVPIDSFKFRVIFSQKPDSENITDLSSDNDCYNLSTIDWSLKLTLSLLNEIAPVFEWCESIMSYAASFPESTRHILNPIWIVFVRHFETAATKVILEFISIALSEGIERAGTEKMIIIVELCQLIRSGSRDNKYLKSVYSKLDHELLYTAAHGVGSHKFALAVFEEFMKPMPPKSPQFTLEEKASTLLMLYEGFDDVDMIYGVPMDTNLDYAIDIMCKDEKDSMRQVMFSSARYDCSIFSGDDHLPQQDLFNSLTRNSLNGLSALVNDSRDAEVKLHNDYDWCWKLNRWDIAPPENPSTEGEMIYSTLRAMKERQAPVIIQNLCQSLMLEVLNHGDRKTLLRTLCTIASLEEINRSSIYDLRKNIETTMAATDPWFKVMPFEDFETLLWTRKIAFELMTASSGESEAMLAAALEMARFGEYARLHGESQKAINNAVLLEKVSQLWKSDVIGEALKKVSKFESACTLWSQGETYIPINILTKDLGVTSDIQTKYFPQNALCTSSAYFNSYLAKWSSESRQTKFYDIMTRYVAPVMDSYTQIKSAKERSVAMHNIANFCYQHLRSKEYDDIAQQKFDDLQAKKIEINELKGIVQNKNLSESERKEAKRYMNKISIKFTAEVEYYNKMMETKALCAQHGLTCSLLSVMFSDEFDNEDVDKFCALWLKFDENKYTDPIRKHIGLVPSHKFIPWLNQLCSRLSSDTKPHFQATLQELIQKICVRHPYHSLYFIMNLRTYRNYDVSQTDRSVNHRVQAADDVWARMKKDTDFYSRVMSPVSAFCARSINLACEKVKNKQKMHLENWTTGKYWLNDVTEGNLPLPTLNNLPIDKSGNYECVPRIASVDPTISISPSGISLPKIMKVKLTDGSIHRLLLKGSMDDLRQDAIMEQVFEKVNLILKNQRETRKRNLRIRTYKVVPLGPQAGIIEFVANSVALCDILKPLHKNDSISFDEARMMMKEVQLKRTKDRVAKYREIMEKTPPVFRDFFFQTFLNMDEWYESRQIYTRGIVTTSIVGYILGLGDRHLNNILLDKKTGEPIHIDFGVAFDQGRLLPVPELVPFRLTRDIIDGLGVTGVEGAFRKGSELVFKVLRDNSEKIIGILDVLRYDPLYTWVISPIRRKRLQETDIENDAVSTKIEEKGSEAATAVRGVEEKLANHGLSVEATVQELINDATDVNNLGVIYLGWAPFY
ncbi:Serine/threonine-protein kinase TEL1 [Cyberlindnera fabianii]|uniref:Serine/threonine-protein kinase Tel1 n=1 Tax=Cyberlindnera fabianii TaxID=36022 RepID=A0A1V2LA07_CYBFA|nr:Serine/threonine-protein kinase TEL1 [Cyberlindnera fabianii]